MVSNEQFYLAIAPHLNIEEVVFILKSTRSVRGLSFAGNTQWNIGDLCEVLNAASHLTNEVVALNFSNMGLDVLFLSYVIEYISRCHNLQRIELDGNFFSVDETLDKDLIQICESSKPCFTGFGVSAAYAMSNPTLDCIHSLGDSLHGKRHLSFVSIRNSAVTDEGAQKLFDALMEFPGHEGDTGVYTCFIKSQSIHSYNTSFSDVRYTRDLDKGNLRVISFHLTHNNLTDKFIDYVIRRFRELTPKRDVIQSMSCLGSLTVYGNNISQRKVLIAQKLYVEHLTSSQRLMKQDCLSEVTPSQEQLCLSTEMNSYCIKKNSQISVAELKRRAERSHLGFLLYGISNDVSLFPTLGLMSYLLDA
eukprot:Tbor_TRINITY_DN3736_c0_g1::TRINITY_DN3736_c0_g1_i1::g.2471::m.2471